MAKKVKEAEMPVDETGEPNPTGYFVDAPITPLVSAVSTTVEPAPVETPIQVRESLAAEVRDHLALADAFLVSIEKLKDTNEKQLAGFERYSRARAKLAEALGALR